MAILTKKRVLIEKTSKMFDRIGVNMFTDKIMFVTNNHAVLFYDGDETKCFVVLTFIKDDFSGENNGKATKFYDYAIKRGVDYGGMTFCGGNNFVTSGFREVLTNDIEDDRIWLVIESLCDYGTVLAKGLSEYNNDKITMKELVSSLKEENIESLSLVNENSVKLTNHIFWEKYPRTTVIGYA